MHTLVFFFFFRSCEIAAESLRRLGEALTHLATRTPKPWRATRRNDGPSPRPPPAH